MCPYGLLADIYPPGCDKASGGQGNTSTTSVNFNYHQAHLGDTVQVFPMVGMVGPQYPQTGGACEAINATGSIYIASGLLAKFLDNATLDPGFIYQCPTNTTPPCTPGPYNVTITPALVGAGIAYPEGSIGGAPNTVRALQWATAQVRTDLVGYETLDKYDSASITLVHPCIRVVEQCLLPQGFAPNGAVVFTGYVTNCGDINLTNVIANDARAGRLVLNDPISGLPLATNASGGITLSIGTIAVYWSSYVPTVTETSQGVTTNSVAVTGNDTSDIGGPSSAVTNYSASATCPLCPTPCISISFSNKVATIVWTSVPGQKYRVQYRSGLSSGTFWSNVAPDIVASASTATNQDNTLGTTGQRLYRVIALP
jgi:hypothetical protein